MLDLQEIQNTIEMLENGDTTFVNCEKLAALYTVRDHLTTGQADETEKEIRDILPSYRVYAEKKARYLQHELPEDAVVFSLGDLCSEIIDLIHVIYINTDTAKERLKLLELTEFLHDKYGNSAEM